MTLDRRRIQLPDGGAERGHLEPSGSSAYMTFANGGRAQRLHEISRFLKEDGRWYYVDGDIHA